MKHREIKSLYQRLTQPVKYVIQASNICWYKYFKKTLYSSASISDCYLHITRNTL